MAYYPLSQITPNLYTDGSEYSLPSGENYTGFYFKTSKGELFTGKTPQDLPNLKLSPQRQNIDPTSNKISQNEITSQFIVKGVFNPGDIDPEIDPDLLNGPLYIYDNYALLDDYPKPTMNPYFDPIQPTEKDYNLGEFRRYFCKKRNELIYIEINKEQYDKLIVRNPQIYWQMYKPFFLTWQLSGSEEHVAKVNKDVVALKSKRENLPKLGDYLKHNYLKYYQE